MLFSFLSDSGPSRLLYAVEFSDSVPQYVNHVLSIAICDTNSGLSLKIVSSLMGPRQTRIAAERQSGFDWSKGLPYALWLGLCHSTKATLKYRCALHIWVGTTFNHHYSSLHVKSSLRKCRSVLRRWHMAAHKRKWSHTESCQPMETVPMCGQCVIGLSQTLPHTLYTNTHKHAQTHTHTHTHARTH